MTVQNQDKEDGFNCGLHLSLNMLPFIGDFNGFNASKIHLKTKDVVKNDYNFDYNSFINDGNCDKYTLKDYLKESFKDNQYFFPKLSENVFSKLRRTI